MSAPRTARDRVRTEVTREILAVAREHLARTGATALSLRSVARDLEMAPSALYRYFPSRDALLSALIQEAYESLADEGERASQAAFASDGVDSERWLATPRAMRNWALAHPHEWGLIFGTPVPGYHAPESTVLPYARLAAALVRPMVEARRTGRLCEVDRVASSDELRDAVAPVADAVLPGFPSSTVMRVLEVWTSLVGAISLELFGHWNNTVLDPELFFEETIRHAASTVGLS